jgi:hypothetical protein
MLFYIIVFVESGGDNIRFRLFSQQSILTDVIEVNVGR